MFTPCSLDGWDLDGSEDRPTWPPTGSRKLVVEDKYEALFFSATWTVEAKVDDEVIARSEASDRSHSGAFVRQWTRQMIRSMYVKLRQLGVDADADYVAYGGLPEDLRQ